MEGAERTHSKHASFPRTWVLPVVKMNETSRWLPSESVTSGLAWIQ